MDFCVKRALSPLPDRPHQVALGWRGKTVMIAPMDAQTRQAAHALLSWYRDAGVDEAIGNDAAALYSAAPAAPAEVMAEPRVPAQSLRPRAAKTEEPDPEAETRRLRQDAAAMAAACTTLDELKAAMMNFEAKDRFPAARNLVFADGNPDADVMLIGEAPGEQEDRQGLPFVGRSGHLLDAMMGAIGLDRTSFYITNVLPWRPMANRTPTAIEGLVFQPFLMKHIELVRPKVMLTLGGPAAKLLLDTGEGIMRMRGQWREIEVGGRKIPVMPTLHPAYLLRTPLAKREAWHDLLELKQRLGD